MKKLLFVILTISLFGACVTYPPATDEDRIFYLDISLNKTFDAIKQILFNRNAQIMAGSKDSGFLNARIKLDSEVTTAILTGEVRVIYTYYNISFIEENGKTKVLLRITTAYADGSYESEMPQAYYQQFQADLRETID